LLFADENGETSEAYVASVLFVGEALLMDEVAALGGPTAEGACAAGAPGPAWPKLPRRTEAIAHRGDSCCAPENTITAIDQAFAKGADHIEIDIRLSKDGQAVVMHDASLRRTTNGSGNVADRTVAELKTLDAGSWFHPRFAGEKIPTLTEAIQAANGRGRLYLDIKVGGMGPAIQQALTQAGATAEAVWPWAHDRAELDYYRSTIAGADILYGSNAGWGAGLFADLKARQVYGFSTHWRDLSADYAAAAHAAGLWVEVFTVIDRDLMRSVVELGADAMETDYPGVLREMDP